MTASRLHLPARALIAIILMTAWLLATNHCALGLMKMGGAKQHEHCSGHDAKPAGGSSDGGQMACCKTIQAGLVPDGKIGLDHDARFVVLALLALPEQVGDLERGPLAEALDTGPPFAFSFAESVLQRSLLSHAPPRTA